MSDLKDVLGLAAPPTAAALTTPSLLKTTRSWPTKRSGVSTLLPAANRGFKKRRARTARWKWVQIQSSARSDDINLKHWVKILNVPDYRFARFNKRIRFLDYADEEYEQYLQHPDWTRAETDLLFTLCRRYDLRFIIIADRFTNTQLGHEPGAAVTDVPRPTFPESTGLAAPMDVDEEDESRAPTRAPTPAVPQGSAAAAASAAAAGESSSSCAGSSSSAGAAAPSSSSSSPAPSAPASSAPSSNPNTPLRKSVSDLKDRFYSIQRQLLRVRNASDADLDSHPQFAQQYDHAYDVERKEQLQRLYKRTRENETQMSRLVLENRKVCKQIKRMKKAQRGILPPGRMNAAMLNVVTNAPQLTGATAAAAAAAAGGMSVTGTPGGSLRKRGFASTGTPGLMSPRAPPSTGRRAPIPAECQAPADLIKPRTVLAKAHSSCLLRSQEMAPEALNTNTRMSRAVEAELLKHGAGPAHCRVPTQEYVDKYNELRSQMVTYLQLKKHVEKLTAERDNLRTIARGGRPGKKKGKRRKKG